jgi:hypothetical protein
LPAEEFETVIVRPLLADAFKRFSVVCEELLTLFVCVVTPEGVKHPCAFPEASTPIVADPAEHFVGTD